MVTIGQPPLERRTLSGMLTGMWAVVGLAGLFVVVTGWLPLSAAREVALTRGAPVLGFLIAVTVLAELSDKAGVFEAAAARCARLARGSTFQLFLLVAGLATVLSVGMSLDTTAVLLTPVVLTLTEQLELRPLPFAILAVWLANTASLLLPVSNLTNLLALQREHLDTLHFAGRMLLPEVVAVGLTVGYLAVLFRRDIVGHYALPARSGPSDPWLFRSCALACALVAPGVLLGVSPWLVCTPLAGAAVVVFAVRNPSALRPALIPWRIVVFSEGLFLVVSALSRHGLDHLLSHLVGTSTIRGAITAGTLSNAANNLPAYLAVEKAVPPGHTTQLLGVLLGTNTAPLIFVWGSLATMLWRDRCRARGLRISVVKFAGVGVLGVPIVLAGSLAALLLT